MESKRREPLNKRSKEIIRNAYQFCKQEEQEGIQISLKNWLHRTELMTGVSRRTVQRIVKENTKEEVDGSKKLANQAKILVDDFDKCVIRRTIQNMYEERKILPTLSNIRDVLKEKIEFTASVSYLSKLLKELGFSYRRCAQNRKVLMERPDVVSHRIRYLRKIKSFRDNGHPIVYTDETYVHSSHAASKCWQSKDAGLKVPFGKGERMIVLHAGGSDGFIPGALLTFKAKSSSGDYHDEMNSTNFMKWLQEMLIPNLPEKSILVLDNAAYHNIQVDRCPTMSTKKADIQTWLRKNGISFSEDMLKAELLYLCKLHKPSPKFVVDELLQEHGHTAIRLPPYHADLNPIELIWANLKGFIAKRNLRFNLTNVKELIEEGIDRIGAPEWEKCCAHVIQNEQEYWKSDIAVEKEVERIVIHIGSDSEVSSDEETDTASENGEATETASETEDKPT